AQLARYELAFQLPTVTSNELAISNAANSTQPSALNLGNYSSFPEVIGVSIPGTGAEDWYRFTMNREGDGLDSLKLLKKSAADALVFSRVAGAATLRGGVA